MEPDIARPLLDWYMQNRRILPFRTESTPYRVWVSEIMLQQTRVNAVLPYYERFMRELPDIASLAACEEERLHKLWEGLGYYSRVRNLQKAAQIVMEQYGGSLPADYDALLSLPGIGAYTAGAIASISFGLPVPAVDGNVLRVFSRLYCDGRDITQPRVKKELTEHVMRMQPPERAGDYNQALMELGALVCVPNGAPLCDECPLCSQCRAHAAGVEQTLLAKPKPAPKTVAPYTVLCILNEEHTRVLLQKRPAKGLLAGLWQPYLAEGTLCENEVHALFDAAGTPLLSIRPMPCARHVFSHRIWEMTGFLCTAALTDVPKGFVLADADELRDVYTLPNAFRVFCEELKRLL